MIPAIRRTERRRRLRKNHFLAREGCREEAFFWEMVRRCLRLGMGSSSGWVLLPQCAIFYQLGEYAEGGSSF